MDILWEKFMEYTPRQKGCVLLKLVLLVTWLGWLTGHNPATWFPCKPDSEYHAEQANYAKLRATADHAYQTVKAKGSAYGASEYYCHLKYLRVRLKELGYPHGQPGRESGRELVERYSRLLREQMLHVNHLDLGGVAELSVVTTYRNEIVAFNRWVNQYDPPEAVKAWRWLIAWARKLGGMGVSLVGLTLLSKLGLFVFSLLVVETMSEIRWWAVPAIRLLGCLWSHVLPPKNGGSESAGRGPPDPVPLSLSCVRPSLQHTFRRNDEDCFPRRPGSYTLPGS